jgi:uncharacterized membrane protein
MTEKQDFLEKLRAALIEREVSEVDINPYIERFDRFFDRMVNDSANGRDDLLENIDSIADNIAAQISERYDEINRLAERTMTVERIAVKDEADKPSDEEETDSETSQPSNHPAETEQPSNQITELSDDEPVKQLPDYIEDESASNSTIFWVLFGVSLPVTIPIALAVLGLFIGVWGALAASIIASIASLIILVAGGTALSLIGIIYGITKLFSVVPIGIYEIGLGVLIGGCVMFGGILFYNFAVRLLPYLIKLVARLFKYLYGQLKVLFVFLRKECAKL